MAHISELKSADDPTWMNCSAVSYVHQGLAPPWKACCVSSIPRLKNKAPTEQLRHLQSSYKVLVQPKLDVAEGKQSLMGQRLATTWKE